VVPNSRQMALLEVLTKSAKDTIIGHSNKGCELLVPILLILSSSNYKAHE
jgi:hypothetical protein